MKKYIFTIAALIFGLSQTTAQRMIFPEEIEIPQGGSAPLTIGYETGGKVITTYIFNFVLPEGITLAQGDNGMDWKKDANNTNGFFIIPDGTTGLACLSTNVQNYYLAGTEGTLGSVDIEAAASLNVDDEFEIKVNKLAFSEYLSEEDTYETIKFSEVTIKVKIVENRIELDENAEEAPAAAENVNVKVLRTINANNWSTICLPFAMNEAQVVEAFGTDVKIAEFTGCTWGDDQNILLDFTSKSEKSIDANHPYIIMVSEAITHDQGFNVDDVTITPDDAEVSVIDADENEALFIGTYEPIAKLGKSTRPALFIAQNKFWYSKGTASLKPYRAYFEIDDLKNYIANAKIGFFVNDEATLIDGMGIQFAPEGVFDLSGRKIQLENGDMNKLQKGVYIINGKKVTIK